MTEMKISEAQAAALHWMAGDSSLCEARGLQWPWANTLTALEILGLAVRDDTVSRKWRATPAGLSRIGK